MSIIFIENKHYHVISDLDTFQTAVVLSQCCFNQQENDCKTKLTNSNILSTRTHIYAIEHAITAYNFNKVPKSSTTLSHIYMTFTMIVSIICCVRDSSWLWCLFFLSWWMFNTITFICYGCICHALLIIIKITCRLVDQVNRIHSQKYETL